MGVLGEGRGRHTVATPGGIQHIHINVLPDIYILEK